MINSKKHADLYKAAAMRARTFLELVINERPYLSKIYGTYSSETYPPMVMHLNPM
jgi:hypothetical protein